MNFKQTEKQYKQDIRFSIFDGIFWILMNSIALTFIVPYIIEMNASAFQVGLIQSFPLFVASIAMVFSYRLLKFFKSKKQSVVLFVTLQALMWLPLAFAHFFFENNIAIWVIIFLYIIINGLGKIAYPIYLDWIKKLFPSKKMGSYFSKKEIFMQLISLIPILLTGYLLDMFKSTDSLVGFTIIFSCAALFRFFSSRFLNKMHTTESRKDIVKEITHIKQPILRIFKNEVLKDKNFIRFLVFTLIFFFGFYIGTVYLSYFLLDTLQFTYTMFVWWKVAFVAGTILSISYWGYIIDRFGAVKIIKIGAFFSPLFVILPALFYNYYIILVIVSFLAGAILPGFILSLTNYLYQNIKTDLINHVVFFTIFQSTAILLGTLFGSWLISIGTRMFETEFKALIVVFIISGVVRIIGAFFSLRIKDKNKEDAHLFRSILLQRPVSYGIREFGHFLSYEEKKTLLNFKTRQIAFNQLSKKEKQKILDKIKKEKKEIMDFILKVEENEKNIMKRLKSSKKK